MQLPRAGIHFETNGKAKALPAPLNVTSGCFAGEAVAGPATIAVAATTATTTCARELSSCFDPLPCFDSQLAVISSLYDASFPGPILRMGRTVVSFV